MAQIDETILVNKSIGKTWTCPHCHKKQKFGVCAEEVLLEHFKYIEQCEHCGYLHIWKLELTDDFKEKVIEMLKGELS